MGAHKNASKGAGSRVPEIEASVVRLYILCRADSEPISSRIISDALKDCGISMSIRSISQILRGLTNSEYLSATHEGTGSIFFRATRQGHATAKEARRKLRPFIAQ